MTDWRAKPDDELTAADFAAMRATGTPAEATGPADTPTNPWEAALRREATGSAPLRLPCPRCGRPFGEHTVVKSPDSRWSRFTCPEPVAGNDRLHGIVRHYVDKADQTLDTLAVAMADEGFAMMSNVDLARIVVAFGEMRRALYGD